MRKFIVLIVLVLLGTSVLFCSDPASYGNSDSGISDSADSNISDSGTYLIDAYVGLRDAKVSEGGFDYRMPSSGPILYNNGAVMTNPINVYIIWYGNWKGTNSVSIIDYLISNIGQSKWFKTNADYYQNTISDGGTIKMPLQQTTNKITIADEIYIGYTYGHSLSSTNINSIITDAINAQQFPADNNAVYYVLTDATVTQTMIFYEFCFNYCGWHDHSQINGVDIKYSFVGDGSRCPADCSPKSDYLSTGHPNSPNLDWSADSMSSVIIHELSEMVTDPDIDGWQTYLGEENADMCSWTFGNVYVTKNNSVANTKIGERDFLIQQNWALDIDGGHCSL